MNRLLKRYTLSTHWRNIYIVNPLITMSLTDHITGQTEATFTRSTGCHYTKIVTSNGCYTWELIEIHLPQLENVSTCAI